MARRSFFADLRFIEKRILRQEVSERGEAVFNKLISFVEKCNFTQSKSHQFIARNWRLDYSELEKLWVAEGNRHKNQTCFRVQLSGLSQMLYSLFPRFARETFLYDNKDGYKEIETVIDIVGQSQECPQGIFISEVSDYRREVLSCDGDIRAADCLETVAKLKPLLKSGVDNYLNGLDPRKVKYILSVLQRPLFSSVECNTEKLALLQALWESNAKLETGKHGKAVVREVVEVPEKTSYNLSITKKLADLVTAHASATMTIDETQKFLSMSESEHDKRKKKLARLLYLFTEEGLRYQLSHYSPIEIREVLEGDYPVDDGETPYKFRK